MIRQNQEKYLMGKKPAQKVKKPSADTTTPDLMADRAAGLPGQPNEPLDGVASTMIDPQVYEEFH